MPCPGAHPRGQVQPRRRRRRASLLPAGSSTMGSPRRFAPCVSCACRCSPTPAGWLGPAHISSRTHKSAVTGDVGTDQAPLYSHLMAARKALISAGDFKW